MEAGLTLWVRVNSSFTDGGWDTLGAELHMQQACLPSIRYEMPSVDPFEPMITTPCSVSTPATQCAAEWSQSGSFP